MQCRLVYAYVNSGTNASMSYKNLVKIGPVTSEENKLNDGIFVATRPQFDDHCLFRLLAFRKKLKYRNFDFNRLMGDYFCILCRNFVRFGLVTAAFET